MSDQCLPKVYAIDDDPLILKFHQLALASDGLVVECFTSGEQFFEVKEIAAVGCVIVDLNLPGISGIDIQARLRQSASDLSVIVVSGGANVALAVQVMQNGALTLLEKPYTVETFRSAVHQGIEWSRKAVQRRTQKQVVQQRLQALTPDERQVLTAIMAGSSNKLIAQQLVIGMRTVERHRSGVLKKMQVGSVAELVALMADADGH